MSDSQSGFQPAQNWNPSLGDAEADSVITTLGQLKQQMPFLVGLTREERQKLPKVGPSTRSFVTDALTTAQANPGLVPRSLDLDQLRSRADTLANLGEIKRALTQMLEQVDDTEVRLASEVYGVARTVYAVMKTPAAVPGLKDRQTRLSQRFARKAKRRSDDITTGVQASRS